DEAKHQFLLNKILTRYADIMTTDLWTSKSIH
ncbi:cysteine hydrolase, partial [Mammaliicoccus sciuri]